MVFSRSINFVHSAHNLKKELNTKIRKILFLYENYNLANTQNIKRCLEKWIRGTTIRRQTNKIYHWRNVWVRMSFRTNKIYVVYKELFPPTLNFCPYVDKNTWPTDMESNIKVVFIFLLNKKSQNIWFFLFS